MLETFLANLVASRPTGDPSSERKASGSFFPIFAAPSIEFGPVHRNEVVRPPLEPACAAASPSVVSAVPRADSVLEVPGGSASGAEGGGSGDSGAAASAEPSGTA